MSNGIWFSADGIDRKAYKGYVGANGADRVIKKGYVGTSAGDRLFYVSSFFDFTGAYSQMDDVTMDGRQYRLYALTSDGVLDCSGGQVWLAGGGAGGQTAWRESASIAYSGYGGGGGYIYTGRLAAGLWTVAIGAGGAPNMDGGATFMTNGAITLTANGGESATGNGGSGGGGASKYASSWYTALTPGKGQGLSSTVPFGLTSIFRPHCAGGGSGANFFNTSQYANSEYNGGAGGSNGSDGAAAQAADYGATQWIGGTGGAEGGGTGGGIDGRSYGYPVTAPTPGSYYGAGGGGGAHLYRNSSYSRLQPGAAGYQGIAYILMPI